jgi:hypothetical protein
MLPTTDSNGQPHRELITFRIHDGERLHVLGEVPGEAPREIVETLESGRFALMPLPDDIEASIVDPAELEGDVDLSEMRIVGDVVGVDEVDKVTVELRVDGESIADSRADGVFGLLWVPIDQ